MNRGCQKDKLMNPHIWMWYKAKLNLLQRRIPMGLLLYILVKFLGGGLVGTNTTFNHGSSSLHGWVRLLFGTSVKNPRRGSFLGLGVPTATEPAHEHFWLPPHRNLAHNAAPPPGGGGKLSRFPGRSWLVCWGLSNMGAMTRDNVTVSTIYPDGGRRWRMGGQK